MTRIRIRCRVPVEQAKPDENGFPVLSRLAVNGRSPDWTDLEVFAVAHDGAETPLTNVDRVEFVAQANTEPLRVAVTFINPEIDVEGVDDGEPGKLPFGARRPTGNYGARTPTRTDAALVGVEDAPVAFVAETFESLAEKCRMVGVFALGGAVVAVYPGFLEQLRAASVAASGSFPETDTDGDYRRHDMECSDYGRLCDELAQAVLEQVKP